MEHLNLRFRALRGAAIFGTISLLVAACGTTSTNNNQSQLASDQTLKFPILDDFGTLDPGIADAETDTEISQNIFDSLYKFDMGMNVVPDLAQGQPTVSSDGLTYTFKLRQDVTFSNGEPYSRPCRVLTSHTTSVSPSRATMSISPMSQRQLRSTIAMPASTRCAAATRSP